MGSTNLGPQCKCGRPICQATCAIDVVLAAYAKMMLAFMDSEREFCARLARIAQLDANAWDDGA